MLQAAEIDSEHPILEIGPGFGVLTEALVQKASQVIAIELEKKLAEHLQKRFSSQKNLTIVQNDFRFTDLAALGLQEAAYDVVANLPYQITSLVIRRLCSTHPRPRRITLLVQKEVAERIIAPSGEASTLSIAVAFYAQAKLVRTVSPAAFWPRPQVKSAILRLDLHSTIPNVDEKRFFSIVRSAFQGKRKKLRNSLASVLGVEPIKVEEILRKQGINPEVRAQDLLLENWLTIAQEKL